MSVYIDKCEILKLQQKCMAHGISFNQLCDRLKRGCSPFAAMNMPPSWEIDKITHGSDGVHYSMFKPVVDTVMVAFYGTDSDLQEFLDKLSAKS